MNSPAREFTLDPPGLGRLRGLEWNASEVAGDEPGGRLGFGARRAASPATIGRIGILHGLGDHAARYDHVARDLAARGYAVEALDLPGHGKSFGRRGHVGSWAEYRASVDAWMARGDALPGGGARALLGQSMGAFVALDWTLAHPSLLRGLVLCAPPFEVVLKPTMLKVRAAQLAARFWPGFTQGSTILPTMLSHDQEVVRAHAVDPLVHYRISARLFFEFQRMRYALIRSAPKLSVPTLILHGGADPIAAVAGSERWARTAPAGRVTLRVYPGLLHEILNEVERPRVLSDLGGWLEGVMAG